MRASHIHALPFRSPVKSRRESGLNADVANSGATLAYLSPGVGFRLTRKLDGFAFIQVPVYQRVNGLQIQPRFFSSVGMRYRY